MAGRIVNGTRVKVGEKPDVKLAQRLVAVIRDLELETGDLVVA